MSLKLTDTIVSKRRADASHVVARLDRPDQKDRDFLAAATRWCAVAGIDPVVVIAQWLLETDNARSIRWNRDLNASGMGIVSDGTSQPFQIPDVDASARLFVQCLYALVERRPHLGVPLWDDGERWFSRVWIPKVESSAMPHVRTVVDLGKRYIENGDSRATWSWEDGQVPEDTYGKKLVSRLREFYPEAPNQDDSTIHNPSTGENPMATLEQLKPAFTKAPVTKRLDGQGFNFGARSPIVGLVIHETQGLGTGPGYQQFFSCETDTSCRDFGICSDGERCHDALVDWLIDQQGGLWEFQDPYNTNRIPWASGGPENNGNDIGAAINGKYRGVFGGVNRVYAAVEMVKTDAGSLTPAQIFTAGKLLSYVMARAGYSATDWRFPDVLGGNIFTAPHHSDISQTTCRISDADKTAILDRCDTEMAAFASGVTPGDIQHPTPIGPDIIPGVDLSIAKRLFGVATGEDGRSYTYDPNGSVSMLWGERGRATGEWPRISEVWVYDDGRRYFLFADGSTVLDPPGDELPKWLMAAAA